jgi:predicted Zn-dependent protease with MMP-like domain
MQGRKDIIMNYSRPPSADDLLQLALQHRDSLPTALVEKCADLVIEVEEFPDDLTERELELDDPYDLLCLYRSAKEITPGVQRKQSTGDDRLLLYRRPILDMWVEMGDDLNDLLRQIIIGEIAAQFDMPEDDIDILIRKTG